MSRDTWSTRLRIAGNDAFAVEMVLADGGSDDTLQVAGQAVRRCAPSSGLISQAATLAASLSRRGWPGYPELIVKLEHLCAGTNSDLRCCRSNSTTSAKRWINHPQLCRTST